MKQHQRREGFLTILIAMLLEGVQVPEATATGFLTRSESVIWDDVLEPSPAQASVDSHEKLTQFVYRLHCHIYDQRTID